MAKEYIKDTFVNDSSPALNATNMNNISNGIETNNRQDLSTVHNVTTDGNRTLTPAENQFARIEETDTGVLLTATREIVMNNDEHTFLFVNSTAQSLTVKTSAGSGITVSAGARVELRNDTVNVTIKIGSSISGTATFTNADNNINLTDIGNIGLEIGDVITVTNSVLNNQDFTVEVITDNDNIIVNEAHAGGTTLKSLIGEVSTAGVTISLLSKWFNAPISLGQGGVNLTASRGTSTVFTNDTGRAYEVCATADLNAVGQSYLRIKVDGAIAIQSAPNGSTNDVKASLTKIIPNNSTYEFEVARASMFLVTETR